VTTKKDSRSPITRTRSYQVNLLPLVRQSIKEGKKKQTHNTQKRCKPASSWIPAYKEQSIKLNSGFQEKHTHWQHFMRLHKKA
jgi:hypothetical protein